MDYKIIDKEDKSYSLVKRYNVTVVINKYLSKDKIRDIIFELTERFKKENFYRSDIVRNHFIKLGNPPAHIIWIDIAKSKKKADNAEWLCQAIYVDPILSSGNWPLFNYIKSEYFKDESIYINWK